LPAPGAGVLLQAAALRYKSRRGDSRLLPVCARTIDMNSGGPTNGVICRRCQKAIRLERTERVAEEFSVACPHCGFRGIYLIKDIKPLSGG
jgi:DNA-directed RNA polymerase subunit RPC12/RpoP